MAMKRPYMIMARFHPCCSSERSDCAPFHPVGVSSFQRPALQQGVSGFMRYALATLIAVPVIAFAQKAPKLPDNLPPARILPAVSAAEELKTIQLPDGYRLELVLSEPDIKEPMAMA